MARHKKKKKKNKRRSPGKDGKQHVPSAQTADIHELYELAVQAPEAECDFIQQAWQEHRGNEREPRSVREDFCGTAITAIEWVKQDISHTAVGVDWDGPTLEVARKRIEDRLEPQDRERISLVQGDVNVVEEGPVDCLLATNFSYYIFKTRETLRAYFEAARSRLEPDGLLILDAYGGSNSFAEQEEQTRHDGFTYVWEQASYAPVTGDVVNHIHFKFKDGSRINEAFTYEWRLWTLPELRELLLEAGFADVKVYWEGTDPDTNEGDGEFSVTDTGDADEGWIAYVVAER